MKQMETNAKIKRADLKSLKVIKYPDPRLSVVCTPVDEVDDPVRALAERMFEIMFADQGIGLAAPQVGVTVRLFVASPSFDPADRRVYVNPEIVCAEGSQESEEGCLSLPGITCRVKRSRVVTIRALNLEGQAFEETVEEEPGRTFRQHETDHLNGMLLVDRMGSVARLTNRRTLRDLEQEFQEV